MLTMEEDFQMYSMIWVNWGCMCQLPKHAHMLRHN